MSQFTQNSQQTQPDTQPLDENALRILEEEDETENLPCWGCLYSLRQAFPTVGLALPKYTFGRDYRCDITPCKGRLSEDRQTFISKRHFVIYRENDGKVFLKDLSRNGTYVNSKKISPLEVIQLQSRDVISFTSTACKVFVYMTEDVSQIDLPQEISNIYTLSTVLGKGGFGQIFRIFNKKTGKPFALKVIDKKYLHSSKTACNKKRLDAEAQVLLSADHPAIIAVQSVVNTQDIMCIVMPLMAGGDLFGRLREKWRMEEFLVKHFFYQITSAVDYLHRKNITHRDLKLENVLLYDRDTFTLVKVTDFGLSKFVDANSQMDTVCGSSVYMAPEVVQADINHPYTNKVDCWSLGVMLFTCLCGCYPFHSDEPTLLKKKIMDGKVRFPVDTYSRVSAEVVNVICRLLVVNVENRCSVQEIVEHKWFDDTKMRKYIETCWRKSRNVKADDDSEKPVKRMRTEDEVLQPLATQDA